MGARIMATERANISTAIGALQAEVRILARTVRDNQEASTQEHRKVHDIVVATSEAVRNLSREVSDMKPLTDDYREKRAEKRGAARLLHLLYVTVGGLAGAFASKVMEIFSIKPHP